MDLLIGITEAITSHINTDIPSPWHFIELKKNLDLFHLTDNISYIIVHVAFLFLFIELCITSIEKIHGKTLERPEKYIVMVRIIIIDKNLFKYLNT